MIMLRLLPSGKLVVVVLLASEPLPEAAAPLLAAGLEVLPPPQEARVPRMRAVLKPVARSFFQFFIVESSLFYLSRLVSFLFLYVPASSGEEGRHT